MDRIPKSRLLFHLSKLEDPMVRIVEGTRSLNNNQVAQFILN
jgi:hypothetical protein